MVAVVVETVFSTTLQHYINYQGAQQLLINVTQLLFYTNHIDKSQIEIRNNLIFLYNNLSLRFLFDAIF